VSIIGLRLEQALASDDAQLNDVLDLVDAAVEHAAAGGDDATLDRIAERLDEVASQRGSEWGALAIAAVRARAVATRAVAAPLGVSSSVLDVEVPQAPPTVPKVEVTPAPAAGPQFIYAGWWRRVFAFLVDWVVVGFVLGWFDLATGAVLGEIVLALAYFTVFPVATNGITPGKAALGIAIRVADGTKIGFARSLRRVLTMCVLWVTIVGAIVDVILAGNDPKRQSVHDKMAGTIVVRTRG
jgi:uncharacterized RDD family membrane protein YckC